MLPIEFHALIGTIAEGLQKKRTETSFAVKEETPEEMAVPVEVKPVVVPVVPVVAVNTPPPQVQKSKENKKKAVEVAEQIVAPVEVEVVQVKVVQPVVQSLFETTFASFEVSECVGKYMETLLEMLAT